MFGILKPFLWHFGQLFPTKRSGGIYEGQSINSDNGSISLKILLESELFVIQNVDMGVAHSCLKYGVFITTRFDGMRICIHDS